MPPGKSLIKVSGILLIVFSSLGLLTTLLAWTAIGVANTVGVSTGVLTAIMAYETVVVLVALASGIISVMKADKPEEAQKVFVLGAALVGLRILDIIVSAATGAGTAPALFGACIGLVLPILLIVGADKNKKFAANPAAFPGPAGYGQAPYGQAPYAPAGQPQYGEPQYGQPQYGQPGQLPPAQPQYGQPGQGQSPYGAPPQV